MDKNILQEQIDLNLSSYKIAEILNCSQTTISYWLRKYGLNTNKTFCEGKCEVCGNALKGKQLRFCSKKCKGELHSENPNNYLVQRDRGIQRKMQCIALLGGCCQNCGYMKNYAALSFHHKDPLNKVFTLDSRRLANTNLDSILKELNKCVLLCLNCHSELHNPHCLI